MVLLLQILLFLAALFLRGHCLFGGQLSKVKGSPDHLQYIGKNKAGTIISRHVGLSRNGTLPFVIKPERWYHRFLKSIGVASEIKMPSESFDKAYFLATDFPHHLERATSSGPLMKLLEELFSLHITSLHVTKSRLWCIVDSGHTTRPSTFFERHFEILDEISKILGTVATKDGFATQAETLVPYAFGAMSVHAGLLSLGLLGVFPTLADSIDTPLLSELVSKGLAAGALCAALWFMLILYFFNKTSWICWVFADFMLCGILGFMLSGIFAVRELNMDLSQPSPVVHTQNITQKKCTLHCKKGSGKRSRSSSYAYYGDDACSPSNRSGITREKETTDYICTYQIWFTFDISVPHWSKPKDYSFESSMQLFDSVRTGQSLDISVNPGALGIEWVDTSTIHP